MNNYCTNCGQKLKKNELVCSNCNTPIVEIPYNYEYISPTRKKVQIIILILIGGLVLGFMGYNLAKSIVQKVRINKLQKNYVEPYLKEKFPDKDYDIKYDSSGRCITSGDCAFDPVRGCDGGSCNEYTYLDNCISYYYSVTIDGKIYTITLSNKDNIYLINEGKNIYGENKKEQKDVNNYE